MAKITKFPGPRAKKPVDPNATINVKNPKVEEMMATYTAEKTPQNLNNLMEELVKARVLIPSKLNEQKQPMPLAIKNKDGQIFIPIYTEKEQIPKEPKAEAVMNMPFPIVAEVAIKNPEGAGVVVNPFSNNLIIKTPLLERVVEVEKAKREGKPIPPGKQVKQVKLTEQQYVLFERNRYEFGFLPSKFFENTAEFVDVLCDRKEEYLDELYEESYQQKRMYPYLPEEFSVMALDVKENVLAVRVDMPSRDMGVPSCYRVYFVYDKKDNRARYFTIEKGKEGNLLGEVTADKKHVSHGEAPVEGAELQTILDMM